MKFKPVIVKWIDITTKAGWNEQDAVDEFINDDRENVVYQCGFLYEEDEIKVCLMNSYFSDIDLIGDITKIPRGCIVEIKYL